MTRATINQLPTASGTYMLTISKWNEDPFEKEVEYIHSSGEWICIDTGLHLGNTDKIIQEAEYYNILSFRKIDKFD